MKVERMRGRQAVRNVSLMGGSNALAVGDGMLENGGFFQFHTHVKAEDNHHNGEEEGYAPSPHHEITVECAFGVIERMDEDKEKAVCEEETEGCP